MENYVLKFDEWLNEALKENIINSKRKIYRTGKTFLDTCLNINESSEYFNLTKLRKREIDNYIIESILDRISNDNIINEGWFSELKDKAQELGKEALAKVQNIVKNIADFITNIRDILRAALKKVVDFVMKAVDGKKDKIISKIQNKFKKNIDKNGLKQDINILLEHAKYFPNSINKAISNVKTEQIRTELSSEIKTDGGEETKPEEKPEENTGENTGANESFIDVINYLKEDEYIVDFLSQENGLIRLCEDEEIKADLPVEDIKESDFKSSKLAGAIVKVLKLVELVFTNFFKALVSKFQQEGIFIFTKWQNQNGGPSATKAEHFTDWSWEALAVIASVLMTVAAIGDFWGLNLEKFNELGGVFGKGGLLKLKDMVVTNLAYLGAHMNVMGIANLLLYALLHHSPIIKHVFGVSFAAAEVFLFIRESAVIMKGEETADKEFV